MRSVVLLDLKIDKDEALALLDEYSAFIKKHTGIEHIFWVERRDFSQVPTVVEADGDMKPSSSYRINLNKDVHSRYGNYGTDNVVMMVHEDNFLYKGIWGQNWSGIYHKHSFQLCRWDKDNSANTFGTLFHEQMHSFDWVIKVEGFGDINTEFQGSWDSNVVHGKGDWDYIRYQENTKALTQIADRLDLAFRSRKDKHLKKINLMNQVVSLLSTLFSLLQKKE